MTREEDILEHTVRSVIEEDIARKRADIAGDRLYLMDWRAGMYVQK